MVKTIFLVAFCLIYSKLYDELLITSLRRLRLVTFDVTFDVAETEITKLSLGCFRICSLIRGRMRELLLSLAKISTFP